MKKLLTILFLATASTAFAQTTNVFINLAKASTFNLLLTNNIGLILTNVPTVEKDFVIRFKQDATGNRTYATNSGEKRFVFGTEITNFLAISTNAGYTDVIACRWRPDSNVVYVLDIKRGYVR